MNLNMIHIDYILTVITFKKLISGAEALLVPARGSGALQMLVTVLMANCLCKLVSATPATCYENKISVLYKYLIIIK